jgi:hypothetical protein
MIPSNIKYTNVEKVLDIFSHSYVRTSGTTKTPQAITTRPIIKNEQYAITYNPSRYMTAKHNVYCLLVLELLEKKYYGIKGISKKDFFETEFTMSAKEIRQMVPQETLDQIDHKTVGKNISEAMDYVFNFPITIYNETTNKGSLTRLASQKDVEFKGRGIKSVYTITPSRWYNLLLPTRFETIEKQNKGEFKKNVVPFIKRTTNFFLPLILPTRQAHIWDFIRDQYETNNRPDKLSFNMNEDFWEKLLPGQIATKKLKGRYRKELYDMELNPAFNGSIKTFQNNSFEVYFE